MFGALFSLPPIADQFKVVQAPKARPRPGSVMDKSGLGLIYFSFQLSIKRN
jgi:hypothetical protein